MIYRARHGVWCMVADSFVKNWYGSNEPTLADRIRGFFRNEGKAPLARKAIMANYRIKMALSRVRAYIDKLRERDRDLFERAVEALMRKDEAHAKMYVNEVAELRKVARQLLMIEYVLEQASLRLETFIIVGETFTNIIPVVGVIKEASRILRGIAPDVWVELNMAVNDLSLVMAAGGIDIGGDITISMSEEAKKIYREAELVAEQRMKEKFPELPTLVSSAEGETNKVTQS